MAINLGDFVSLLKRESRYGSPAVTNDTPTSDILAAINMRLARIWAAKDWKWQREKLSFAVVPGTSEYTVAALSGNAIDRILNIIPNDTSASPPVSGKPLNQREIGDFYTRFQSADTPAGLPTDYVNIGMNSAGAWRIIIAPSPSSAFTMKGFAKAVLTTYVLADITSNNPILYFPNGVVLDSLFSGVMTDIGMIQGVAPEVSLAKEGSFEKKIHNLAVEQMGVGLDNTPPTSPPPDRVSRRMSSRRSRGTRVF